MEYSNARIYFMGDIVVCCNVFSVESNASFPTPGSTLMMSCLCCNVLKVWKIMRVFQCLDLLGVCVWVGVCDCVWGWGCEGGVSVCVL